MERATAAVLVVGARSWVACPSKPTSPIFTPSGRCRGSVLAAALAASSRFGFTSVACIDSEVSMARITTPFLSVHLVGQRRAGEGEGGGDDAEGEHDGRDVAAPARLVGGDLVEQGDVA